MGCICFGVISQSGKCGFGVVCLVPCKITHLLLYNKGREKLGPSVIVSWGQVLFDVRVCLASSFVRC